MDIIEKATKVAVIAHKEQVRKSDGSPYVVHPLMVARMLDQSGFDEITVAAAIVHDVLEDTDVTEAELRTELGDDVVDIVLAVSEDKALEWEERKAAYAAAVASASDSVKAVSVADKIHNGYSVITYHAAVGPAAWTVFNRGKEKKLWFEKLLLSKLKETWQHPLLDEYEVVISKMEALPE